MGWGGGGALGLLHAIQVLFPELAIMNPTCGLQILCKGPCYLEGDTRPQRELADLAFVRRSEQSALKPAIVVL